MKPARFLFVAFWTRNVLIAIGIALFIIVFLCQPVKIEGDSMAQLLSDQQRIFINVLVCHFEPIERQRGRQTAKINERQNLGGLEKLTGGDGGVLRRVVNRASYTCCPAGKN